MKKETEWVVVDTLPESATAALVAGILKEKGIPVQVEGSSSPEWWGTLQKVSRLSPARVEVPREHLEAARQAIEEAHQGRLAEDESVPPANDGEKEPDLEREEG